MPYLWVNLIRVIIVKVHGLVGCITPDICLNLSQASRNNVHSRLSMSVSITGRSYRCECGLPTCSCGVLLTLGVSVGVVFVHAGNFQLSKLWRWSSVVPSGQALSEVGLVSPFSDSNLCLCLPIYEWDDY